MLWFITEETRRGQYHVNQNVFPYFIDTRRSFRLIRNEKLYFYDDHQELR